MYKLPLLQVLRLAFHGFVEVRQLADKVSKLMHSKKEFLECIFFYFESPYYFFKKR